MNTLRAALVIGRRDFAATVFSKAFVLFLLGPLFPLVIGLLFGSFGASVANQAERPTVAFIGNEADYGRLYNARGMLKAGLGEPSLVELIQFDPQPDTARQTQELLQSTDQPVTAVLTGGLDEPSLIGAVGRGDPLVGQIRLILAQKQITDAGPELRVTTVRRAAGSTASARTLIAHGGQALLFLLTLLLAGMLLSQLIEEKSSKVIEVLAAAVPVDAIFLGKLFAMLLVSLLGIAVWTSAAVVGVLLLAPEGSLQALPPPALGWPGFALMAVIYFAFGYLLIGAAFLGIGAQASTIREVQTLSMPITMSQVIIFAIAASAVSDLGGPRGLAAAAFPLSSPFAMIAWAASDPRWWPHIVALLWQALWVGLILRFAARIFRRSVLKSGGARRSWWRRATSGSA